MRTAHHNDLVVEQYTPRSNAYLTSSVHASGEDLALMRALVGERADAIVLDMGCGGGHVAFTLAPQVGKVVAYDLSAAMLATVTEEAARRGIANIVTKQGAAEALPCPDASFDVVVTRYSAHHWHAFAAGLQQMFRALKPGGMAIFADVVSPGEALLDTWLQSVELLRDPSHVRNASLGEWNAALKQVGFVPTREVKSRLRLEFASWIGRMQPPQIHVDAIRSLQAYASPPVAEHFALEPDGSFTLDTAMIVAVKPD